LLIYFIKTILLSIKYSQFLITQFKFIMNTKSFYLRKLFSSKQLISKHFFIFFLFMSMGNAQLHSQVLKVYTNIPGRTASDKYVCKVKVLNSTTWQDAFVIQSKSFRNPSEFGSSPDNGFFKELENWTHSYIAFESDFSSVVEVEIAKKDGSAITKVPKIRPEGEATATILGGKAYVRFSKAANVYVDIDGQMEENYTGHDYTDKGGKPVHAITVFANPIYNAPVATQSYKVLTIQPTGHSGAQTIRTINDGDWDAIIFAPGVHNIGTQYNLKSNKTLYIPGDAIVHGTIHPTVGNKNWKVYGSGAISGEQLIWNTSKETKNKVFTNAQEGITVEGFVVIDPTNHTFNMTNSGTATNVYRNLKILGWRKNADGVNAFRHSLVTDCFFRTQDDCFYLGTNVKIQNITTWTDANGAVMYLARTSPGSTFNNIKCIYARTKTHSWNKAIIEMRDTDNDIENIHLTNVTVEDPYPTMGLFRADVKLSNLKLNNIVFENFRQDAKRQDGKKMLFNGNSTSIWKNVTFKNCTYQGKCLSSLDDGNWTYNSFVDKPTIKFICGIEPVTGVVIDNCVSTLSEYATHTFKYTVSPEAASNKNVTWSSSNNAVATVDATTGLVTAIAVGSATITATTVDGGKTATCNITVTAAPSSVIAITPWTSGSSLPKVANKNRLLTVMVMGEHTTTDFSATAVSYGGQPMTKVAEQSIGTAYHTYAAIFILNESGISAASSGEINVSWSTAPAGFDVYSVIFANVDQNNPIGASAKNALEGTSITTSALSAASGDIVVMCGATANNTIISFDNGFDKKFESNAGWGDGVGGYKMGTGANEIPQFTQSAAGRMVLCAMVVKNAEAVSSVKNPVKSKLHIYPNPISDILNIDFANDQIRREVKIFNSMGQLIHRFETTDASTQIDVKSLKIGVCAIVQVIEANSVSTHRVIIK
jgi:hypothetical protein